MSLEEYMLEWAKDAPIPKEHLDEVGRQVPYLHAKWWRYLTEAKLRLRKLELEYKTLYKNKFEWYNDKMIDEDRLKLGWEKNARKVLPAQIPMYIDADPDVQAKQRERILLDETVNFLIDVIKHINNRSYLVSNITNYLRFSMGT
jgi:hypothetical protein